MKNKWKYTLIILGIAAVAAYLVFAFGFGNSEKTEYKGVSISIKDSDELQFITEKNIEKILLQNGINLQKMAENDINLEKIETLLQEKCRVIRRVECYKTGSGKLKIDVWQKRPLFRVMGGRNYYIDEMKKEIPLSPDFSAFVPIVTGNTEKTFLTGELFEFMLFLQNDNFWQSQITQIDIDKNYEITLVPRVGKHTILLGTLDNYEEKMKNLLTFYKKVSKEKGWNRYSKINLQFENQIICTK